MYIYIYTYIHVCIYIYIYTHTLSISLSLYIYIYTYIYALCDGGFPTSWVLTSKLGTSAGHRETSRACTDESACT